jgi:2C-methyl-D-erythritol 2,4-cyclodiphosphate synthase
MLCVDVCACRGEGEGRDKVTEVLQHLCSLAAYSFLKLIHKIKRSRKYLPANANIAVFTNQPKLKPNQPKKARLKRFLA